MEHLSPELLHIVVSFLDISDSLNFRLVSRNFSVIGAAYILPEVAFHLHGKDFAKLRAIAANPVIARNVKSLSYFSAVLESPPVSYQRYIRQHETSMKITLIDPELGDHRRWKMNLTIPQLKAHYDRYVEMVTSQNAIMANQLDLVCLKEVLPAFTNLRRVTMSSGHQFYEGRKRPKSPYDECVREAHHNFSPEGTAQLEVLLESLAHHEISIEQLRAGTMSWRFFDKPPDVSTRLFSPLSNLTYIDLVLVLETDDNGEDVTNDTSNCRNLLERGAVRDLLKSMPGLETLAFGIHGDFESRKPAAYLDWIIAPGFHWPNLTEIALDGLDCSKGALTQFLELHKTALIDMCLKDMSLTDGSWRDILPYIRTNLDLRESCICGRLSGYSEEGSGIYHDPDNPTEIYDLWIIDSGPSDMRASVNCYCKHRGEGYPDELPLSQRVVRKYFESHVRCAGLKSEAEDAEEMRQAEKDVAARIRSLDLFRFAISGQLESDDSSDEGSLSAFGFDENAELFFHQELEGLDDDSEDESESSESFSEDLGDEDSDEAGI